MQGGLQELLGETPHRAARRRLGTSLANPPIATPLRASLKCEHELDLIARPVRGVAYRDGAVRCSKTHQPVEASTMNWDTIEGNWKVYSGRVKERWGKLTDDDLDVIQGKRDQLEGRLQKAYGLAREDARREVEEFAEKL